MIRGAVLAALARAIDEGGGDAAAQASLRVDPVLRGLARRRLGRALERAMLEAPAADGPALLARAYLLEIGRAAAPGQRDDDVARAFAGARADVPVHAPARWPSVVAALLAVLVAAALVFVVARSMRGTGAKDAAHRRAPPPAGAFAEGGVPAAPAAAAEVFAKGLPAFSIALDRLSARLATGDAGAVDERQAVVAAAAALPGEAGAQALGPAVCARLAEVLRLARAVVEDGVDPAPLLEAAGRLDDELAAAALGLYVDVDVLRYGDGQRRIFLYAFRVETVRPWQAGARTVRALRLRRLDTLNFEHAALGFARPNLREALVLMDQAEDELLEVILPALVADAPLVLSREPDDYAGRAALEAAAGARVRAELGAALGEQAGAAVRLSKALADREAALDRVEASLDARGLGMARPTRLYLPEGYLDDLAQAVAPGELAILRDRDATLSSEASWRAFGAIAALLADSIERHEVQHRLDYAMGGRAMPAALVEIVGPAEPMPGQANDFALQAKDELSAYLAQLGWDERLTGVNVMLLARLLLVRSFWGSAESNAAIVMFEGLARRLALPHGALVSQGRVHRDEVATLVAALLARPPAEVRAAAAGLWQESFGEPLPAARVVVAAPAGSPAPAPTSVP